MYPSGTAARVSVRDSSPKRRKLRTKKGAKQCGLIQSAGILSKACYEPFGALTDYPKGQSRIFLQKSLADPARA
jgi:hypothetical protein